MRAKPSDAKDILDLLVGASDEKEDDDDGGRRHLDVFAILALPPHLRRTAQAIHSFGRASAAMVSEVTGREGSLEDSSLQELVEMGYLGVDMGVPDIFYLYYEK
jgi:hypothetical protein